MEVPKTKSFASPFVRKINVRIEMEKIEKKKIWRQQIVLRVTQCRNDFDLKKVKMSLWIELFSQSNGGNEGLEF